MSDESLKNCLDPRRAERLNRVASQRTASLTLVLENIFSSHNISAVLRSADAFGVRDVHIIGQLTVSEGIALGTEDWLRIHNYKTPVEARDALLAQGYELAVTAPEEKADQIKNGAVSLPVFELPFESKLALVFGNEKDGVSPTLFEAARYHAFIPMFGFVESFNISVACAICLFCSTVRIAGPERRAPLIGESEQQELIGEWLRRYFKPPTRLRKYEKHGVRGKTDRGVK